MTMLEDEGEQVWSPLPRSAVTAALMADVDKWARPFLLADDTGRLVAEGVQWPRARVAMMRREMAPEVSFYRSMDHLIRCRSGMYVLWAADDEEAPALLPVVGQVRRIGDGSDVSGTSGEGVVCDLAVSRYSGEVVEQWRTEMATGGRADDVAEWEAIHGHGGATSFAWLQDESGGLSLPMLRQEAAARLAARLEGLGLAYPASAPPLS